MSIIKQQEYDFVRSGMRLCITVERIGEEQFHANARLVSARHRVCAREVDGYGVSEADALMSALAHSMR